jgi:hypothetical protein
MVDEILSKFCRDIVEISSNIYRNSVEVLPCVLHSYVSSPTTLHITINIRTMAPLSLESAKTKLLHTSSAIQRRNGVRPSEVKRIKHAASLLREGSPPPDVVGAGRQTTYLHFLREVQKLSGNSMVVLCAAGLGLSAIAIAREKVLLDLPHEINSAIAALDNPVLRRLANEFVAVAERTHPVRSTSDPENSPAAGPLTVSHHRPSQNIDQDKAERTIEQRSCTSS